MFHTISYQAVLSERSGSVNIMSARALGDGGFLRHGIVALLSIVGDTHGVWSMV